MVLVEIYDMTAPVNNLVEHAHTLYNSGSIAFNLKQVVATGRQGELHLAHRTDAVLPTEIAVKNIRLDPSREGVERDALRADLKIICSLSHPSVVRHLHHFQPEKKSDHDAPCYFVIMEYCPGGTLHNAAKFHVPGPLLQRWARQIAEGLVFLHGERIIHRDLKGLNILLTSANWDTCRLKIADLGSIKRLRNSETGLREITHSQGTWAFMSPEMMMGDDCSFNIGRKADIWSYGCVVLEMICGFPRFLRMINGQKRELTEELKVILFVAQGGSPSVPADLPTEVRSFIDNCLLLNPEERPSAAALLITEFMTMANVPQWPDTRPLRS